MNIDWQRVWEDMEATFVAKAVMLEAGWRHVTEVDGPDGVTVYADGAVIAPEVIQRLVETVRRRKRLMEAQATTGWGRSISGHVPPPPRSSGARAMPTASNQLCRQDGSIEGRA